MVEYVVPAPKRRRGRPRAGESDARDRILAAAIEEFGGAGYDGATIRGIAARAGVDSALIHHHFGTKADLFGAVIDAPMRPDLALPEILAGPRDEVGERIVRYVLETWEVPEARRRAFPWPGLLVAPVLVVPYVDPTRYVERYAEPDKSHSGLGTGESAWSVPYWWVDGGAAVMAMLLAAESEGLGALFFGQFGHEDAVREAFGVPAAQRALGTVGTARNWTTLTKLLALAKTLESGNGGAT